MAGGGSGWQAGLAWTRCSWQQPCAVQAPAVWIARPCVSRSTLGCLAGGQAGRQAAGSRRELITLALSVAACCTRRLAHRTQQRTLAHTHTHAAHRTHTTQSSLRPAAAAHHLCYTSRYDTTATPPPAPSPACTPLTRCRALLTSILTLCASLNLPPTTWHHSTPRITCRHTRPLSRAVARISRSTAPRCPSGDPNSSVSHPHHSDTLCTCSAPFRRLRAHYARTVALLVECAH